MLNGQGKLAKKKGETEKSCLVNMKIHTHAHKWSDEIVSTNCRMKEVTHLPLTLSYDFPLLSFLFIVNSTRNLRFTIVFASLISMTLPLDGFAHSISVDNFALR